MHNIWVYTENGVCLFDGYTFRTFTTDDGLPHNDVFWMGTDKTGKMWALTLSWTVSYLNKNHEFIEIDSLGTFNRQHRMVDGFQRDKIRMYTIDQDQNLSENTDQFQSCTIDYNSNKSISNAFGGTNSTGKFYFGGYNTDFFFVADDSLKYQRSYWFKNFFGNPVHVSSISHLNNKKIVLETNSGYLFLDSTYTHIKTFAPPELCDQYFMMRYFEDNEGNIWLGSKNGGLFQIPYYTKETEVLKVPQNSSKFLFKIIETEKGIYPVSKEGDIYTIKNHQLKLLKQLDLSGDLVGAIPLNENELWLADRKSSYIYQHNTNMVKPFTPKPKNLNFRYDSGQKPENLTFDPLKGNRDIAYNKSTNTLYRVNPKYVTKLDQNTNLFTLLSNNSFRNVMVLSEKDVFFFKFGGLYKEVGNRLKLFKNDLGIINTLHKIDEHYYLLGTRNKGIYLFNEKQKYFKLISKLNHVRKFYPYKNQLYIACDEGVIIYEQKEHLNWQELKRYDTNIGLPSLEVLDLAIRNDTVYASTSQGLAVFNTHINPKTNAKGSLQIQYIYVNGDTLKQLEDLQLNHQQNNLTIAYHLQHYGSNGQIEYAYQLEPLDTNWRYTKERVAQYARLKAGDYSFRLKAKNFIQNDYELNQTLDFTIKKVFWKRWWFIALCLLVIIGSLDGLYHYRRKQIKLKIKRKEKEVNQQIAELKMESLRAQMNPHFIFNALGSIQYYIQDHKIEEADEYLALFAQLIRRYLDSAVNNIIKLKDELLLLKEYTELEEMRFETRFITQIEVDSNIYPDEEWLPSMFIQPFVENAINHGLQKREKDGLLQIKFWKETENKLVCEICDNGIGMTNSNKNKRNGHKSRAMQNVNDRLEVFKHSGIVNVKVSTFNITNDPYFPGTRVKLQFTNFNQHEEIHHHNY